MKQLLLIKILAGLCVTLLITVAGAFIALSMAQQKYDIQTVLYNNALEGIKAQITTISSLEKALVDQEQVYKNRAKLDKEESDAGIEVIKSINELLREANSDLIICRQNGVVVETRVGVLQKKLNGSDEKITELQIKLKNAPTDRVYTEKEKYEIRNYFNTPIPDAIIRMSIYQNDFDSRVSPNYTTRGSVQGDSNS